MNTFADPAFRKQILSIGEAYGDQGFWRPNLDPNAHPDATWRALLYFGCLGDHQYAHMAHKLLQSNDSRVRAWACFALGQMRDEQALENIYELNADPSNRVRIHAWQAVQAIVGPEESGRHFSVRIPTTESLILLSDDDSSLLVLLVRLFTFRGFRTASASTASQTLLLASQLRPQAILTDNQKGRDNLSGLTMTWDLARQPALRESVLIMVSADDAQPAFLWNGGDYYVRKPFAADDLATIVLEYLHH